MQIDAPRALVAWERFGRLAAHDPAMFERAAMLTLESPNALRAGDARHLACAERWWTPRMTREFLGGTACPTRAAGCRVCVDKVQP
ncbi:MAG: hypothetical protein IAE86_05515 [Burkholderiaceae bacterium]|nr:hypothetical protein [Burkholderiaceae bacterium]